MSGQISQAMDIWIPGTPKPQPSKNASLVKKGKKLVPITRTPTTANDWKNRIQTYVEKHIEKFGWVTVPKPDPVYSELWFVFKRPQNHIRSNGELKPWAPTFHTLPTDRDNLEKALNDPLMWVHLVEDDGQICMGPVYKIYHRRMEGALVKVRSGDRIPFPDIPEEIRDMTDIHEIERQPVLEF